MSMAATRRNLQRWGGCIAYGPTIEFGLPIAVPEDRPLVIAHPAAAMHHHASFGLVSDAGHPFIHEIIQSPDVVVAIGQLHAVRLERFRPRMRCL